MSDGAIEPMSVWLIRDECRRDPRMIPRQRCDHRTTTGGIVRRTEQARLLSNDFQLIRRIDAAAITKPRAQQAVPRAAAAHQIVLMLDAALACIGRFNDANRIRNMPDERNSELLRLARDSEIGRPRNP